LLLKESHEVELNSLKEDNNLLSKANFALDSSIKERKEQAQ